MSMITLVFNGFDRFISKSSVRGTAIEQTLKLNYIPSLLLNIAMRSWQKKKTTIRLKYNSTLLLYNPF